jgi:hypothetical protein
LKVSLGCIPVFLKTSSLIGGVIPITETGDIGHIGNQPRA